MLNTVNIRITSVLKEVQKFLNNPVVKPTIKKIIGIANVIFGIWAVYDLIDSARRGTLWSNKKETLINVIEISARVSVIGLALSTWPGSVLVGRVATAIFGDKLLLSWFGPNLNFATTPWHPRHVVSIVSVAMGVPALVYEVYLGVKSFFSDSKTGSTLKERVLYVINTFNVLTSRAALHCGNALMRRILV